MNLKQLLFLKCASGSRELSFTYTLGAYIERYGTDPYVRTACSPYVSSTPNRYAAGYVTNQEYYAIQNKLEDEVDKYPIRFGDANKIILDVPDYIRATVFFVTSLEKTGGYAKFIDGDINPYDSNVPLGRREIVIPEGADSFGFSLFYPNGLITDDIMKSIKVKAIKADWIERLITGNPVSFVPNAERDLLKFDVPLTCSQSGSGDPSPSNVRPITGYSGVGISHFSTNEVVATAAESTSNGLNWEVTADGTVIYNGKPTAYSGRKVGNYYVKGNETIHCYLLGDIDNIKFDDAMIFDESGIRLATVSSGWSGKKTPQNQGTLDLSEYPTAYRVEITVCRNQNNVDMNGVCTPVVGEDLSIPDSYNIAFPALGKNLWDGNGLINGTTNGQGKYTGIDTKRVISPLIFLGAGTFTLSCAEGHPVAVYAFSENNEDTFVAGDSLTSWQTSPTTFTLTTAKYVRFKWKNQSDTTFSPSDITKLQIESGTATSYEPYTNTVYGGTLDVTTGVLTLTYAHRKYVGASGEQWYDNSSHPGCFVTPWAEVKNKRVAMCNMSPPNNNTGDFPNYGYVNNQNSGYNIRTHLVNEALTVSQFKSWLAEHPLELVCPLINPVTVQLDPVTIQTLIGTNTIWTNTNGSNTIKYLKKEG